MFGKIRNFNRDEDGAVTVDWVVLSAVIVGFATVTVLSVRNGAITGSQSIADRVSAQSVYLPN